jgi:light-regulated signal transduction histidine kinase (bacteriophytochrome)
VTGSTEDRALWAGPDEAEVTLWMRVVAGVGVACTAVVTTVGALRVDELPLDTLFPVALALLGLSVTGLVLALVFTNARTRRQSTATAEQVLAHLRARERELVQSNRELERFASIAAHDLQEPLRTVLTFADLVERRFGDEMSPEARGFNLRIAGAAARMRNLIEDLLVYARVGQEERTYESVDLAEVADEAVANLEQLVEETGATVDIGPLPRVLGNRPGLLQVFTNLVSNACKYRMAEAPEINILSERVDDAWVVAVQDNGKGIDPAYHDRVFELFRRLESRNQGGGTGLGLAICKRVIDLHGGKIWVRSQLGQGSTFYFTLPNIPGIDEEEPAL